MNGNIWVPVVDNARFVKQVVWLCGCSCVFVTDKTVAYYYSFWPISRSLRWATWIDHCTECGMVECWCTKCASTAACANALWARCAYSCLLSAPLLLITHTHTHTHTYTYIHTYIHTYISQQHTSRPRQHSLWRGVQTLWAAWAAPPTTFVWGARLATSATTQQSPSQRCSFELQCTNVVIVIAFLSHPLQRLTFGAVFADFDKMLDHFGTRCHRLSFNNFCWYLKYTARASAFMVKQSKNHKKIALFSLIYPLCNSVEPFCKCNNICCFIWSFSPRLIWKKTKKKFASRRKEPSKIDTCLINSRPRIEVNKACSNKVNWLAIAKKKATKQ